MTADRRALRRSARTARAALAGALSPPVRRGLQAALAEIILPHLGPPGLLGSHAALGDEIDPAAVEQAAEALGWRLAYPRVTGDAPLQFHETPYDALLPGHRGIPEPPATAPLGRPDVLLVPLLAVDLQGNRLGQGGGHYDRTLAALRAQGPLLAIGVAWDVQLVALVAPEPWDQPLDAVATPTAFHLAPSGARRPA
jgi:5-formyltetrahydrofolate cyclo-ligase